MRKLASSSRQSSNVAVRKVACAELDADAPAVDEANPMERRLGEVATREVAAHELHVDEPRACERPRRRDARRRPARRRARRRRRNRAGRRRIHRAILTPDVATRHTPSLPVRSTPRAGAVVSPFLVPFASTRRPRHLQVVRSARRPRPRERHGRPAQPDRRRRAERHRQEHAAADPRRHRRARRGRGHAHARRPRTSATCRRNPNAAPGETVRAYLGRRTGCRATAEHALESRASRARASANAGADDAYSAALDAYLALGAADFDARVGAGRAPTSACRNACSISTCARCRAARPRAPSLAAILLARFDVFLLDEPTNDLDFAGLDRLERFLHDDLSGRRGDRARTTGVPRSHDHERARARRARAHRHGVRRRLGGVPRRARDRAPARRGGLRDVLDRSAQYLREPRAASSGSGRCRARPRSRRAARPTSSSATSAATAASTSPPRPRSPTGRSRGSRRTRSTSRGRAGTSAWRSRPRPAAARSSHASPARSCAAATFTLGPIDLADPATASASRSSARNGSGKTTLLDALLGRLAARRGRRSSGPGRRRRRARPGPRRVRRRRAAARPLRGARAGSSPSEARSLLAKFGLGADHVGAAGRLALAGRAHPRVARAALGPGRQLPRARRADQPSRSARDRAARAGAATRSRARCCS